jgi:integrase
MPYLRKLPSGLWQATVRLPDGKRATAAWPHKRDARNWGTNLEMEIKRGRWKPTTEQPPEMLTVSQWRELWMSSRARKFNTARREDSDWKLRVKKQWGDKPLDAITRLEVQTWSANMARDGVGATSHRQAVGHLRQLMRAAIEHNKITADPTQGVKPPPASRHVDRILTRAEWRQLDAATGQDPMIRLMLWCGLRWQEAAGLCGDAVDLGRGQLWVLRVSMANGQIVDDTKSAAGRRPIPIPPDALESLGLVMRPGRIFCHHDGTVLTYRKWHRRWSGWVRVAKLPDPQPTGHDLRHTFATWLADGGVNVHDVASVVGHSDTRSTGRYIHSGQVRDSAILKALEDPDEKKIH